MRYFITLILVLIFTTPIFAERKRVGVVYRIKHCDYFLAIDVDEDYYLLEWQSGYEPELEDILEGEVAEFGFKKLYNITTKRTTEVWVEDYQLSKEDAIEKLYEQCEE